MSKVALSQEQEDIVLYNEGEGSIFVEASAGSGKTRILTERVRYLLTEKKDKFFSVLCLTFTNKAAEEMKDRLFGIPKLNDRTFIGNFHEFCLNIVRSKYNELGFSKSPHLFDENDLKQVLEDVLIQNPILKEIYSFPNIIDINEKSKKQRETFYKCIEFISKQKRDLIEDIPDGDINEKWGENTTLLYQDYNRRLREQNAMDYDDILLFAYRILLRPSVANIYRRLYKYILIDEAQDLNFAQYNIIKAICGSEHKNILMVGDPKQAIYGFNGASPKFMQDDFIKDFGATKKEIKFNYRSSESVLKLAEKIRSNGVIGQNYFEGITEIESFENQEKEAEWIVSKIKYWKEQGFYTEEGKEKEKEPIDYKNIVVLARNKFVFSSLIQILEKDDILKDKFYLKKGVEKYEPDSDLIKVFDLGLKILVNPYDILHFKQIQNILKIKVIITDNRLNDLLTIKDIESSILTKNELELLCKYWEHLIKNPKSLGWVIEKIKEEVSSYITEEKINELEKINFDLSELSKFWNSFIRKESSDSQTVGNFRYFLALNGTKEDNEELTLATVHTTKGQEFEIVFLMGMAEGVFPDYRARTQKELNEERNNAYVAVTRAKRVLYLTYPLKKQTSKGEFEQKKSSFI